MSGYLTTHILDTANGVPARGVSVKLYRLDGGERVRMAQTITNQDGRTDEPLIEKGEMKRATYELEFHIGEYFGAQSAFLDIVPVRFRIEDENAHYHVPLLAAPFGYSTYRGS